MMLRNSTSQNKKLNNGWCSWLTKVINLSQIDEVKWKFSNSSNCKDKLSRPYRGCRPPRLACSTPLRTFPRPQFPSSLIRPPRPVFYVNRTRRVRFRNSLRHIRTHFSKINKKFWKNCRNRWWIKNCIIWTIRRIEMPIAAKFEMKKWRNVRSTKNKWKCISKTWVGMAAKKVISL